MKDFKIILNEDSPRAETFLKLFGRREVCIKSPIAEYRDIAGFDVPQQVYMLDLDALTEAEEEALAQHICETFGVPIEEVILGLAQTGVPILAAECIVVVENPQRWLD